MCHEAMQQITGFARMSRQRGSMLLISVFIIVVMSLLGLVATELISNSSDSVSYEVMGLRAMNAARTGLEDKILDVFPHSGGPADLSTVNLDLSGVAGLINCEVTSQATVTNVDSASYYRFSATGTCLSGDLVVSRTLEIDAREVN